MSSSDFQKEIFDRNFLSVRPYVLLGLDGPRQILLRLQASAGPGAFADDIPPELTGLERAEASRLEARIEQFQERLEARALPRERAE